MDAPLGRAVGNAVEVRESIEVLRNAGPADVRELTLRLGVEMLIAGEAPGLGNDAPLARKRLETALADGGALKRFAELIEAQGGDPRVVDEPGRLPQPRKVREVRADRGGVLTALDAELVGLAAVELGAGRARKEDAVDPAAGLVLHKRVGDEIRDGDVLAELHAETDSRLDAGELRLRSAVRIGDQPARRKPLILERIA
jgi:thymidine phosphorylase